MYTSNLFFAVMMEVMYQATKEPGAKDTQFMRRSWAMDLASDLNDSIEAAA
jgi:hypothetical protein